MIMELFRSIVSYYLDHIGYGLVILLMAVESSFIPFPSEIVIPPAAWMAARGELNLVLVILAGIAGSLIGALFNYYVAVSVGRALIYRFAETRLAHFMLIDRASVEKAEEYFRKHGKSSTFIGRLVPAIRQLISVPAGLAKMNMKEFFFYTTLGSSLWTTILAVLGYYLYSQKELLERYYDELSYAFLGLGVLFFVYLLRKGLKREKR